MMETTESVAWSSIETICPSARLQSIILKTFFYISIALLGAIPQSNICSTST